jgi:hypothetical protein
MDRSIYFDTPAVCMQRGAMTFAFSADKNFAKQLDAELERIGASGRKPPVNHRD